MIGAIFGDIVGSVYEFDNIKTKDFELFSSDCTFTDDTVMTVAVADALLRYDRIDDLEAFKETLIDSMHRFGNMYLHAGYGSHFGLWLITRDREPYGSYGNGAAMRVSPVAWYARSLDEALALAKATASVSHDHPEGIKGAEVTAGAAYLARTGKSREDIRTFIGKYYDISFILDEIRHTYYFSETCQETVPQAMEAFLESSSFEDAVRNGIPIGGDSDTLCAICGGVAEAFWGLSEEEKGKALAYLEPPLREVVERFCERYVN